MDVRKFSHFLQAGGQLLLLNALIGQDLTGVFMQKIYAIYENMIKLQSARFKLELICLYDSGFLEAL